MKYDPEIGVFGMDVSVSLQRPGWRVARRSNKSRRIPRRHRVTRDEGMQFMKDRFKVEVVVWRTKDFGRKRGCLRCGRKRGIVRRYGLHVCRQCFREIAYELGFRKYS